MATNEGRDSAPNRARLRDLGFTGIVVLALTVLSWQGLVLAASPGLDGSWPIGLGLALEHGLSFATRVVFTYGPLGAVLHPVAVSSGTLVLEVLGATAIQLAFVTVLVQTLRARVGLPAAALITLAAVSLTTDTAVPAVLDAVAFGAVSLSLARPVEESARRLAVQAICGGAVCGLALLTELNQGIAVVAIVTIGLLGKPRPGRHLAIGAGSLALTATAAWLLLGQPIGAIPDYIANGYATVTGYAGAMGYDVVGRSGDWQPAVLIASAIALTTAAWKTMPAAPRRRRAALALNVLIVHYFVAREMFTRYDSGHVLALALLPAIALLLPWRREQARWAGLLVVGLTVASLVVLGGVGYSATRVVDPVTRANSFVANVRSVLSPGGVIASGRAQIRAADDVPKAIVTALDGHCVDVVPWEVATVFAYSDWRWCPVGVMQAYEAYTPRLDQLDAAGFADARNGPDRVLRQHYAIDDRNPVWESPAAMLSLLCHFRQIASAGQWQALARIPDRCGRPYVVATLHAASGETRVPPAPQGTVLIARFSGLHVGAFESLEALLTRARERTITINGEAVYRVIPATTGDGLILDVPGADDYRPPFNLNLGVKEIGAAIGPLFGGTPAPFSVTLIAVPIS